MSAGIPPPELLEHAAHRFRALADTSRLTLINAMREGEQTVSQLVAVSGLAQASVSRHLGLLHGAGLVNRRREGTWVYYSLADDEVGRLCDLMCARG